MAARSDHSTRAVPLGHATCTSPRRGPGGPAFPEPALQGAETKQTREPRIRGPRSLRAFGDVFRTAAIDWWNDDSFQLAAALAFYTVFSLAPLVVIAVALAGAIFGEEVATRALVREMDELVGRAGGEAVRSIARNAQTSGGGFTATVIGLIAIAVGSTAVFAQLQAALNKIWDVEAHPDRSMIIGLLRDRLLGFGLALGTGFVLVVSLVASAVLSATQETATQWLPNWPQVWRAAEMGVSFLVVTGLFMAIYKVLPDVRTGWWDVAVGATVTALLFSIGKLAIGFYLGRWTMGDAYGAAGSFAVLLVWVYYTALVSFYGAEFTQVFARRYGSRIRPAPTAIRRGEGKPARETPPED